MQTHVDLGIKSTRMKLIPDLGHAWIMGLLVQGPPHSTEADIFSYTVVQSAALSTCPQRLSLYCTTENLKSR